jgi:hypothetical protein
MRRAIWTKEGIEIVDDEPGKRIVLLGSFSEPKATGAIKVTLTVTT